MSYDEPGDPTYNPFAEHNDYRYSTSSVPNLSKPLSLSAQESVKGTTGEQGKRKFSIPEISIVPEGVGCPHPLKSALARQNDTALYDLGVTRPHLSRIINESTLINDNLSELENTSTIKPPSASDEETEVIVHEVSSKDSLAGISLKYGISLPNLRKANQLWVTDSIHLRDVLYIPLKQAFRARELMPGSEPVSLSPGSHELGISVHAPSIHISEDVESAPTNPLISVRRMPSNKLTFFPPSSNKNLESNLYGHFRDDGTSLNPSEGHKSRSNNRYISAPAINSLSSILTVFPIAASTRDAIVTRLSFDSVSSGFSDRSRTNSDEDTGHELDDVAKHTSSRIPRALCEDVSEMSVSTPKALQHPLDSQTFSQQGSRVTSSSSLPKNLHSRSLSSPPRLYVPQALETSVRTYQMEPSPDMQLPTFKNHAVVHSSGRRQEKTATGGSTIGRRKSRSELTN